ncbi:mucoidy inhibitor MuiA family protein [Massilia sp. TSP1-1-2]|uniref:mucoidy inhibitor MuiA family protein n=1 Tax=Massilia sp. TSP1-1-2 TaxID=2804649 RepID=UPI003CF13FA9
MRHPMIAACALGLLSTQCLAGVSAPVTSVTLYPGSATVTRTAQVSAGATEVVLPGLPANVDLQTLRVKSAPGIRIAAVVTQEAASSTPVNPAEAALAAKIEALTQEHALLGAEIKSATIVKNYIEHFDAGAGAGQKSTAGIDAKGLAAIIGTLGHGASESLLKIEKLTVQQRAITGKIEALQRDLATAQSGTKDTRQVTVRLTAANAGTLMVSYQLANAGWKALYRASLDSHGSTVDLERQATIIQNTGEDWSKVKMTLSTAKPGQSPVGAQAQPWLLSWRAPQPAKPTSFNFAAAPAPVTVSVSGNRNRVAVDEFDTSFTAESQTTFATQFDVPGYVTLASDGREVTVSLSSQTLAVKQHLRVTPRLEKFAIVMAEAARPDGVWPAGTIQLFRDGSYIGATQWALQDGEKALFSFGRDELLTVSVAAVEGMSGSKGIFNGRAARNIADVFTLVNRHKKAIDVIVIEASPVATAEEIKVQATFEPQPGVLAWEERRGVVAWTTKLAAGDTAKFKVAYSINFPKDGAMVGLR